MISFIKKNFLKIFYKSIFQRITKTSKLRSEFPNQKKDSKIWKFPKCPKDSWQIFLCRQNHFY